MSLLAQAPKGAVKLRIDPDLRRLIPPLGDDELAQLEANLVAEGCRDPIVAWKSTILDGHNRYAICTRRKIAFVVVQAAVGDRDAAKRWMLVNQLGRRNLSPSAAADLRGMLYLATKQLEGGDRRSPPHSEEVIGATAEVLAASSGVSAATVQRDAAYSAALDVLEAVVPDIRAQLHKRDGALGKALHRKDAVRLAKMPLVDQAAVLTLLTTGAKRNAAAAIAAIQREHRLAEARPVERADYRVIEGDAVDLIATLDDGSVHCVVTDPPYGIETHRTREGGHDYADGEDYAIRLLARTAEALEPKLVRGAHVYVFSGYTHAWSFREILAQHFDVRENPLVWVKNRQTIAYPGAAKFASRYELIWFCCARGATIPLTAHASDVLEFDSVTVADSTGHSAEKPVDLLTALVTLSSVEGDLVLDPFCGSGSTGAAASALRRHFVGFEIDPAWAAVARGRA